MAETLRSPGQEKTKMLDKPLFVAAGAGSGANFTLTQRIVWALKEGSGADGKPYLSSLDQALIITFTNAAAKKYMNALGSFRKRYFHGYVAGR